MTTCTLICDINAQMAARETVLNGGLGVGRHSGDERSRAVWRHFAHHYSSARPAALCVLHIPQETCAARGSTVPVLSRSPGVPCRASRAVTTSAHDRHDRCSRPASRHDRPLTSSNDLRRCCFVCGVRVVVTGPDGVRQGPMSLVWMNGCMAGAMDGVGRRDVRCTVTRCRRNTNT